MKGFAGRAASLSIANFDWHLPPRLAFIASLRQENHPKIGACLSPHQKIFRQIWKGGGALQ